MRLTFVLFQMSQLRAAKRVCKNPGTKAYYLTKSVNDVDRREWLYRDGAARKVLGDRDFVFVRDCRSRYYNIEDPNLPYIIATIFVLRYHEGY